MALGFLFVLMPFLFWRQTWFGGPLSSREIGKYLQDSEHPRKIQHALSQICDRIVRGDAAVKPWYPEVAALAKHSKPEIRTMAAWVMGQDNTSELFHQTLLAQLHDPEIMVRRNAALGLVRFGDASGRAELVGMLQPGAPPADQLAARTPGADQVWEALRGLYLVGQPDDLPAVERIEYGGAGMPDRVRQQAQLTAKAIHSRSERGVNR
jgi:hypothetical protein